MKQHQRVTEFYSMVTSQHHLITSIVDAAWVSVTSTGELPRLREFLTQPSKGVHYINGRLPPLFAAQGYEVKLASILVHQKPIVVPLKDYDENVAADVSSNPELGDLNLVFLFLDSQKNVRLARSILYQAKTARVSNEEAIHPAHQKYLYDRAPGFRYLNGHLKDQTRRLPVAQGRRRGLHYLFVSESPTFSSPVPSHRPAYIKWSESFFRLLIDAEGVGLAAARPSGAGWSKINQDLVSLFENDSALKAHNLGELASWFNDFKDPNHWHAFAGEGSVGVNTLFVIVRDTELPPRKPVQLPITLAHSEPHQAKPIKRRRALDLDDDRDETVSR